MTRFPAEPGIRVAPSLLAADYAVLREQVGVVEGGGADLLQLDVMDGHFVPNISFGWELIRCLRPHSKLFFDAHLMIEEPQRYAERFVEAGCEHITFHIEVTDKPAEVIEHIRGLGASVGICINPGTGVEAIEAVVSKVDMVLVMSVWPGFGGQGFIGDALGKVERLRGMLRPEQRLEIDGGIDADTIGRAVRAGADTLVAGSAVFGDANPAEALQRLRSCAEAAAADRPGTGVQA